MFPTHNKRIVDWVKKMARLCQPDDIVWIDGSESQKKKIEEESLAEGEIMLLNQQRLPGCFLHRTTHDDVARTEHLTYVCTKRKKDAGPTNNWMSPGAAYKKARAYFRGAMKSRV
ncbi:MAG: phosphoenolpyruvate carboxykinase, partial [Deltaproteobacteria bacterium]